MATPDALRILFTFNLQPLDFFSRILTDGVATVDTP